MRVARLDQLAIVLVLTLAAPAVAQQATLSLSSGSSVPGGSISLDVSLTTSGGAQHAAVQWTMTYPPSAVATVSVAAGASATAAGKTLSCAGTSGNMECILWGLNANILGDGQLATATFTIAPGASSGAVPVQITGVMAVTFSADPIPTSAAGGTMSLGGSISSIAVPVISSVSPNPVPASNGNQTLFINGSGFQNGAGLDVRLVQPTGQSDLQGLQVNFLSPSQLSIVINASLPSANWSVQVFNPNGQSSNVFSFTIADPLKTTSFALPQFVFGGAWYTALYFSNPTSSTVSVQVNFYDDNGAPLNVPLLGVGTVTSQTITLNPSSTVILEAPNNAGISGEGWVEATLPEGVVGYAVFRQSVAGRADQEAVVPLAPESSQTADLIYDDTNFTTAVAFLNPSNQAATVTVSVLGPDGSSLASTQVVLAPRSKQSAVLKALPGLASVAGQRGQAVFSASGGAVSVLGLRFGGSAFTSIPVTYSTGAQNVSSTSFALPQVVYGGGWYTALYFSNTTTAAVSFPVNLYGDDGTPFNVPFLGLTASSFQLVNLAPGATAILEAPNNTASSTEGWANAILPPGVTGYAVFRQSVTGRFDQEAVVPLTSESNQIADLIYDDVNFTTSVAFANPSNQTVVVSIAGYAANGAQIASDSVTLTPQTKQAVVLKTLPGMQAIAGNRGWANFSVPNGAISVLGLRFGVEAFTSIPVPHR